MILDQIFESKNNMISNIKKYQNKDIIKYIKFDFGKNKIRR